MNNLAVSYAAVNRYSDALKLCEETLSLQQSQLGPHHPDTTTSMYNIACLHALMIPQSDDGTKQTGLAMEWLQKAVAAGYTDIATLSKDKDLDALRGREDFKKLVTDLEGKLKSGGKPNRPRD
jgi:hypothetical protein